MAVLHMLALLLGVGMVKCIIDATTTLPRPKKQGVEPLPPHDLKH